MPGLDLDLPCHDRSRTDVGVSTPCHCESSLDPDLFSAEGCQDELQKVWARPDIARSVAHLSAGV